jgi:hypothetical protein
MSTITNTTGIRCRIKVKTAAGTQQLDGIYPSANAAWTAAWSLTDSPDAAIFVQVIA